MSSLFIDGTETALQGTLEDFGLNGIAGIIPVISYPDSGSSDVTQELLSWAAPEAAKVKTKIITSRELYTNVITTFVYVEVRFGKLSEFYLGRWLNNLLMLVEDFPANIAAVIKDMKMWEEEAEQDLNDA